MAETKAELIQKLEESRKKFHDVFDKQDVNKIIYPEGGWRARDIMLNVAYWEYEFIKSINAFLEGTEYVIPNFFDKNDEINRETTEKFKDQDYGELLSYFDQGRVELIATLQKFSDEDLSKELTAFYGAKTTIAKFIHDVIDHEQAHLDDVIKANA